MGTPSIPYLRSESHQPKSFRAIGDGMLFFTLEQPGCSI